MQSQTPYKPKSPIIAAVLNFLAPGLGYAYVGTKRFNFRMGLMISLALALFSPAIQGFRALDPAFLVSGAIMLVVFAVDAYEDARETQRIPVPQEVSIDDKDS